MLHQRAQHNRHRKHRKLQFFLDQRFFGQGIVIGIGLIVLTWLSGNSVIQGTMNVGDFVLINGYLLQFVQPLSWFGYILRKMRKGLTDLENIFNMLHLQPEVSNAPSAIDLKITKAEVTFDHVSFGYDPSRTILRDVSFHVPAGKHLGIVGPSGAGKSTIARLLFRFYDVNKGAILINNHYYQVLRTAKLEQLSNNQTILNLDISPILLDLNELSLSVLQQQKEKIEEQAELIRSLCESNNTANQNEPSSDVENSVSAFFNRNSALLTCGAAGVGFGLLIGLVTWSNSSGNS
jgi:ABC-type transport system involved in Fe-S cluster assembly fused permease/ATPase subunit